MTDPSFEYIDPTSTLPDLQKTIGVAAVALLDHFQHRRRARHHPERHHPRHSGRRRSCLRAASAVFSKPPPPPRAPPRPLPPTGMPAGHRWRGGHGGAVKHHVDRRQHGQRRRHHHRRFRSAAALRARPARRRHHRQQGRPRTHRQIQTQLLLTYGHYQFELTERPTAPLPQQPARKRFDLDPTVGPARPAAVVLVFLHRRRVVALGD